MTEQQRSLIEDIFYTTLRDKLRFYDDNRNRLSPIQGDEVLAELRALEHAIEAQGYKDAVVRFNNDFIFTR